MKKLIYLLIVTVFFVSCTEESNNELNQDLAAEYFAKFLKSDDFKTIKVNYPNLANGVDLHSKSYKNENGVTVFSLDSKEGNSPLGSILFIHFSDDSFQTLVQIYDKDASGEITNFNIKGINKELVASMKSEKVDDFTYSLTLDRKSMVNQPLLTGRSWLTCTRECVNDAFSACSGDTECSILCTVTGLNCVGSISATCAVWCAVDTSNDLTPPPSLLPPDFS